MSQKLDQLKYAALMAQAGIEVMNISKRLSHSTIAVTSNFYGHLMPSVSRKATSKVSQLMDAKSTDVHTLHTQDQILGPKNALAETINDSDKGVWPSPLADLNRRPALYEGAALPLS